MLSEKPSPLAVSVLFCMVISVLAPAVCNSQEWSRKGKSDFYFMGHIMSDASSSGLGVTVDFNKPVAGGLGVGYSFDDHFNLNFSCLIGASDISGRVGGISLVGDTTFFSPNVNIEAYFLKGRLTPLLTGGIGYMRFDGDWSGVSFQESNFSYNVGAGFRWDAANRFMIKAIYRGTWTNLENSDKATLFQGPEISVGLIF